MKNQLNQCLWLESKTNEGTIIQKRQPRLTTPERTAPEPPGRAILPSLLARTLVFFSFASGTKVWLMHKAHRQQPFHGRLIILSRSFIENLTKIPPMTLIDSGSRSLVSFHGFLLPRTRFLGMGTIIFIVAPSLV